MSGTSAYLYASTVPRTMGAASGRFLSAASMAGHACLSPATGPRRLLSVTGTSELLSAFRIAFRFPTRPAAVREGALPAMVPVLTVH
jgi:hypothetical protein